MQPEDSLKKIDLIPVFSPKILDLYGEDRVRAKIEVKPKSLMRIKAEKAMSNDFTIYGIGKINWAYGEDQAAAFVTAEDPIIRNLALDIVRRNQNQPITINEPVTYAHHIFNYLKGYGIGYIGDSKSTYGKIPIDNIYYPRELLAKKMGDCDDAVVLLASLYQSIGIPTAFASIPEHIFMMFDTGISKSNRLKMCLPSEMYCINDNKVWVPVETTWMDKSFIKAWERGANLVKEHQKANELKIVEVNNAWQKYKPIPVSTLERIITAPEVMAIINDEEIKQDKNTIAERRKEHIKTMENSVAQYPDNLQIRNELATTYAMIGNHQKAKNHYQIILEKDSLNFNALNNLANTYFMEGILDSAHVGYIHALENAPTFRDSNGVYLNMGTLYAAIDSSHITYEMYANVVRDLMDTEKGEKTFISRVEELIGLSFEEIELTKADKEKKLKKVSPQKIKKLVKETITKKIKPKGYKVSRTSATKQRRPKEDIEDVFFWAY